MEAAAVMVLRGGDLTLAGTVVRLRPAEWPMAEDEDRTNPIITVQSPIEL